MLIGVFRLPILCSGDVLLRRCDILLQPLDAVRESNYDDLLTSVLRRLYASMYERVMTTSASVSSASVRRVSDEVTVVESSVDRQQDINH